MNELTMNRLKTRLPRAVAGTLILIAVAASITALVAQPGGQPKAKWPTGRPHKAAIDAFTAALSKASWDSAFRQRLLKSTDEAKAAVAEIGNIDIPANIVILFYPPGGTTTAASSSPKPSAKAGLLAQIDEPSASSTSVTFRFYEQGKSWLNMFSAPVGNENYHVFLLPPLNENDRSKTYEYKDYLRGCYDVWWD